MAQRTGADDFIAPGTRYASARVILALAAAVLLAFAGCGSDSSGGESTSAPSAPQQTAKEKSPGAASRTGSTAQAGNKAKGNGEEGQGSTGSAASAGQGKQSPPVQLPEGKPEPTATPAEEAQATVADILLESPDLPAGSPAKLPSTYTCDGKDTWPTLRWQGVPPDTEELILFAINVAPVEGKLFFDWALAGIDPELEDIETGKLPKNAVLGRNSFGKVGYSICPPQGQGETYFLALHAVPRRLSPAKGFDPHKLRRQALAQAANAGLLAVAYGR